MTESLDYVVSAIAPYLSERRALLWVCQRYDLIDGMEPHSFDAPWTEVMLKYRTEPISSDALIAKLPLRAIWMESASSTLLSLLRETSQGSTVEHGRKAIVLASEADSKAKFSSSEFLPIFALSGLLDENEPPAARFGGLGNRSRERVAWELSCRLEEYQNHMIVVVGARNQSDLSRLFEVLDERAFIDQLVVVISDDNIDDLHGPESSGIRFLQLRWTVEQFYNVISDGNLVKPQAADQYSLRVTGGSVEIKEQDLALVRGQFKVLTEADLVEPDRFTFEDMEDFFNCHIENWRGFAAGSVVPRDYAMDPQSNVRDMVLASLSRVAKLQDAVATVYIQMPTEESAGATTIIRQLAFDAAKSGHPTLVLRDNTYAVDMERLKAFATGVVESCHAQKMKISPTLFLVMDTHHFQHINVGQILQVLAASGRSVVALQAVRASDLPSSSGPSASARKVILPILRSATSLTEIARCRATFAALIDRWELPINTPTVAQWAAYERSSHWIGEEQADAEASIFWVVLRFFVVEGSEFRGPESLKTALSRWINRRLEGITDARLEEVLHYVALLSSFRVSCLLWTALRPVFGERVPASLSTLVRELKCLVDWIPPTEGLPEHYLRFRHPVIAMEFLRRSGLINEGDRLVATFPLLKSLSFGSLGDLWVAETLAAGVLAPKYTDRGATGFQNRLLAFENLPSELSVNSKTVLHHWSRCLYQASEDRNYTADDQGRQLALLNSAVDKIEAAIDLPQRSGREEHPSHLHNTAGTASARLALFLEKIGESDQARDVWRSACDDFRQALLLSGNTNVEALLAFSKRLIDHMQQPSTSKDEASPDQISDAADALVLLDDASEVLMDHPDPDPQWSEEIERLRSLAFSVIDPDRFDSQMKMLKATGREELAAYCHAQFILRSSTKQDGIKRAVEILKSFHLSGGAPSERLLLLWLSLLRQYPTKELDFAKERELRMLLESLPEFSNRPIDQYRHAVLCYQIGQFREGAERFRVLRDAMRVAGSPQLRVKDFWRNSLEPDTPRTTSVRVTRWITDWRADGYVADLQQTIPLRPTHFSPPLKMNDLSKCAIRFTGNGPLAVPVRFEDHG